MPLCVLQETSLPTDVEWHYTVPPNILRTNPPTGSRIPGKMIKFSGTKITLEPCNFPSNRILHDDDPSRFILASFKDLKFPDSTLTEQAKYIGKFLSKGLVINGVQYKFYHHSNSQLRGRTCFLRQANSDVELDQRIYSYGDFGGIMNVAKRAKRIGLLFSEASMDAQIPVQFVQDISDLKSEDDELYSDGCGLASKTLLINLSKSKKIIFKGRRYTPCVIQIRYKGYKGVLSYDPRVPKNVLAQFRKSMKKFTATKNDTFSVVNYSRPFTFGRLNNDVIVLLSSLGISNDTLLRKQNEYFQFIAQASHNLETAFNLFCTLGKFEEAERLWCDDRDDLGRLSKAVRKAQLTEVHSFAKEGTGRFRSRIIVEKSRLLFGICDAYDVLKEGQVHVRIRSAKGDTTIVHGDVLIVRNPCLYPGDCIKLRAVQHPALSHLVDCVVFAAAGKHPAPAMSSGGDLDGDQYFVCWDQDLVLKIRAEPYDYPPNKERKDVTITRANLALHFAQYNNSSLAQVASLHGKWVRSSPKGALCVECQELNALHSQSVDGAPIKIPERLRKPPEPREYIIDLLETSAKAFASKFANEHATHIPLLDTETGLSILHNMLKSPRITMSEYELFEAILGFARKHSLSESVRHELIMHLDWSALSSVEKHAISSTLSLNPWSYPQIWNSLFKSDLIGVPELREKHLNQPLSMQRLYSSKNSGIGPFWRYLKQTMQEFFRKLILFKTDDRFVLAIFIRGQFEWGEDPEVSDNVVVCSFLPQTSSSMSGYKPCPPGYRLHCGDGIFQLYNKNLANTFIFIAKPARPETMEDDVIASVALQNISKAVQKQIGRVNRTPITQVEMHVISNRDRVAHQAFDLWFEHVPTETYIRRFEHETSSFRRNSIFDVDWMVPPWSEKLWIRQFFTAKEQPSMTDMTDDEIDALIAFGIDYHEDDRVVKTFVHFVKSRHPLPVARIVEWLRRKPILAFAFLHVLPPNEEQRTLPDEVENLALPLLECLIGCANEYCMTSLECMEMLTGNILVLSLDQYAGLLWFAANSVRSQQKVQEVLFVLNQARRFYGDHDPVNAYAHTRCLGVAVDRAEEAFDECPCSDDGKPRRQKTAPARVQLQFVESSADNMVVIAAMRLDSRFPARLHSHVRLQASSHAENAWIQTPILDGVVTLAPKGELQITLAHQPPPEVLNMHWNLYHAGSIATSQAMFDAVIKLSTSKESCCGVYSYIVGDDSPKEFPPGDVQTIDDPTLNSGQTLAVLKSLNSPLSLIWGPPGTGKTTVVVQILKHVLQQNPRPTVLVSASTHNAVDNVLERFVVLNQQMKILSEEQILRVATDVQKVNQNFRHYTIDARVGGDMNENNKLFKKAQERLKNAVVVFSTCAGSGLGVLRKFNDFDVAIVDEASQITEPCALIPLVKGVKRVVLVGDHVQLRPTVRRLGEAVQFDVSLLERLYTGPDISGMSKTMLDMQYRFPKELAEFPSQSFYHGRLKTAQTDTRSIVAPLLLSKFPWPMQSNDSPQPTVFVPCSGVETDGASKGNEFQVELTHQIVQSLQTPIANQEDSSEYANKELPKVTILTPYKKQVQLLKNRLGQTPIFTVDSFQGRESDIIIFSAVRCNPDPEVERALGFVQDRRRLNVMWTRARLGLIIVGHRETMERSELWKLALQSCAEVPIGSDTSTVG